MLESRDEDQSVFSPGACSLATFDGGRTFAAGRRCGAGLADGFGHQEEHKPAISLSALSLQLPGCGDLLAKLLLYE
jgi:hypothetical protein